MITDTHSKVQKLASLVVQWLRLCVPNTEGTDLILGWGTKILHGAAKKKVKKDVLFWLCPLLSHVRYGTNRLLSFSVLQRPPGTPVVWQDAFFFFFNGLQWWEHTPWGTVERLSNRVSEEASKGFGCKWVVWERINGSKDLLWIGGAVLRTDSSIGHLCGEIRLEKGERRYW